MKECNMLLRYLVNLIFICLIIHMFLYGKGNNTFDFLRLDVGARAAALGSSFVTSTNDPNLIFYNPAGLTSLNCQQLSMGFFKHLLDVNAGYISYGRELSNFGFVGGGIIYINYGEFKRTGEEGQQLGTYSAGEFVILVGYGSNIIEDLSYGINAKFIYSSIADVHSTAAAVDFGAKYVVIPDRFVIGASILNLGTQIDPYMNTREKLPLNFTIGSAIYPEHLPAVIFIDLHRLNDYQDNFIKRLKQFSIGVELTASPNVILRVGYNNEKRQELKLGQSSGFAGLSIGGGFVTERYTIDYGYNSLGRVGSMHRISVGFRLE